MEQQDSLRIYLVPGEKELALVQSSYKINTNCLSMYLFNNEDKLDVTIKTTNIMEVWNNRI